MPSEIPVIASMWSLVETLVTKSMHAVSMAKYGGSCSKDFNVLNVTNE